MIAALSAMSLFHELLYQRTFWFLLGAALATVRVAAPARQSGGLAADRQAG
jgi:hypothetical protein